MAAKNIEPIYGLNMKKSQRRNTRRQNHKNINCNLAVLIIALMLYLYPIISNIFSDIFPFVIFGSLATSSGVPEATSLPPFSPPSGPRSTI